MPNHHSAGLIDDMIGPALAVRGVAMMNFFNSRFLDRRNLG